MNFTHKPTRSAAFAFVFLASCSAAGAAVGTGLGIIIRASLDISASVEGFDALREDVARLREMMEAEQ